MAKKFDLYFSIGEACLCTQALRSCGLQFASYPMDWLAGTNFTKRCEIIASDFDRYIDINDLSYISTYRNPSCDAYYNRFNDLTFNHDFPRGEDLVDSYSAVKAKYDRRIERLIRLIRSSQKVMMVYIEVPFDNHPSCSNEEIEAGWKLVNDHFPNTQVDLLYIQNTSGKKIIESINEHITKISADYKDHSKPLPGVESSPRVLKKLLRGYSINIPLWRKVKIHLIKWGIGILPSKKLRNKLRKQYHV